MVRETLGGKGPDPVGTRVRVKAVKNKVGPPLRIAEFNVLFGQGIDWAGELVDQGVAFSLIKKSGSFYTLVAGEPAVQGRDAARKLLHERPELAQGFMSAIKASYAEGRTAVQAVAAPVVPDRSAMTDPDFGEVVPQDG